MTSKKYKDIHPSLQPILLIDLPAKMDIDLFEKNRQDIYHLYVTLNQPLEEVRTRMKERGIDVS
jgi:hypothetical protein